VRPKTITFLGGHSLYFNGLATPCSQNRSLACGDEWIGEVLYGVERFSELQPYGSRLLDFELSSWLAEPLHFLHHDFVVRQHYGTKFREFFASQCENDTGKRGIERGNTVRETEPSCEEAPNYFLRLAFVRFYRALRYNP